MEEKETTKVLRSGSLQGSLIFGILAVVLCLLPFFLQTSTGNKDFPQFGQNDFLEYWTAFRLALSGTDYTNPDLVAAMEQTLGWTEPRPLMMWNPPWTLSILSPILILDFETASRAFLSLNLFCLLASTALILDVFAISFRFLPFAFLFGFCSIPVFFTLHLGQVSILLLMATSGLYWAFCRGWYVVAGLFLFLLSIKVHVVFLFLLALLPLLDLKKILLLVSGFIVGAAVCLLHLHLLLPGALSNWLSRGKYSGHPLLVDVYQWRTTSFVTLLRDLLEVPFGLPPPLLIFGLPLTASVALLGWEWEKRRQLRISQFLPGILPLSCLFSPFAWIFDASVCLITQLALFRVAISDETNTTRRRTIILSNLVLQIILLFQVVVLQSSYEYYWYYNLALFLFWYGFIWKEQRKISF